MTTENNNAIVLVRGKYINRYEMQNYEPWVKKGVKVYGIGSLRPLHRNFTFPLIRLFSPVDLPNFPYKMPLLNRLFLGDAMWLFGLSRIIKRLNIRVAAGRETYFYFTYQLAQMRAQGDLDKLLVTCSETRPFNHEGIWGRKRIKDFVRRYTDIFHTLTVKAKNALIAEGVNPEKIKVIPYGVDQERFYPLQKKMKSKQLRVLFVGRLVEEKGVRDLIKIYKELKKQGLPFKLEVVGKGPLSKLILENGLTPKTFSYSEMPEVYRQADILLSLSRTTPYWEELFGMNLVEAMSSGVVPLAYDSGAVSEVVKNQELLVEEGDWQGVVKKILLLQKRRNLLKKLRNEMYYLAKKEYDSQVQAEKLFRLFFEEERKG